MKELIEKIDKFNKDRDWDQFHHVDNLIKSIAIETSELLECVQWDNNYDEDKVKEELADVLIYSFQLAMKLGLDIKEIMNEKIELNAIKYPVSKAKGKSDKYNEL